MNMSVPISPKGDDQMEPGLLLEESWFFGNLLDRKSRMLRCYSDPCPSYKNSTSNQDFSSGKSIEETFSSLQKLPQSEKMNLDSRKSKPRLQRASSEASSDRCNLQRAPSLPVFVDYKEEPHDEESDFSMGKLIRQASITSITTAATTKSKAFQESEQVHDEESEFSMGKLIRQASINKVKVSPQMNTSQLLLPKVSQGSNLQRAPSLPVFAKGQVIHDEENEFSMGKLIRQASLNHAKVLPPKHTSKGLTRSPSISSITKHHSRRKQYQESRTRISSNDLQVEDLQSFKNLDLNNEKVSTPDFANTTPGLKDKNKNKPIIGLSEELVKIRRPEDHMKEQIKYWARAVASNVR